MQTVNLYHKATKPPSEKDEAERAALQSQKILSQLSEIEELNKWLALPATQRFITSLETLDKGISSDVILLSGSNEVFNTIGKNKAFECKILRKVINYARTGKYDSE